ncbi:hypothetical protein SRABI83_03882 [Arthrobacter sp. Bi83]|jgi:hypothetical protein|nr:hypothetical protein SRABI83_03882 [Arthrobacter sp. Bi83]
MPVRPTTITNSLFEDKPKTQFQLFDLPQHDAAPPTVGPDEESVPPRAALNLPDIFPLYPFL